MNKAYSAAAAVSLVLVAAAAQGAEAPATRPNIIFLMDDQHRCDALGRIDPGIKTPTLDGLTADGVLFTQAVCQAPMCVPSRYSLMTGLYPHRVGVLSNGMGLRDAQMPGPTIAEVLRQAGYQTAGFGKTHWSVQGSSTRGFEVRYTSTDPERGAIQMSQDDPAGLARYNAETKDYGGGEENIAGYLGRTSAVPEADHRDGWALQRCLDFLDKGVDAKRPLFLYLSFLKPHAAHNVPPGFEQLYDPNSIHIPEQPALEQVEPCHATGTNREKMYRPFWSTATPDQWRQMMLRYRANCSWTDDMFGRALGKMRAKGLLHNCLIIYTSDHGEMLGERYYRFNKYCLFEHSVRVPLIVAGTAVPAQRKGKLDIRPAELVDIFPTILSAAGLAPPEGKPGISLLGAGARKAGFCEFNDAPGKVSFMWRTAERKLILSFPKTSAAAGRVAAADIMAGELYDLQADAREWNNLYSKPEFQAERERLSTELIAHLNAAALPEVKGTRP